MKKYLFICIACCCTWGIQAQTVKIMSLNIHGAQDATIEDIAAFIKSQDPDIVTLQEVEYYTKRSKRTNDNNEDMLCKLAYLSGMQGMFYPIINVHSGKFGNAILSKYGMEKTTNVLLPYMTGTELRAASVCRITLPEGTNVSIVSTHLDMANLQNGMDQVKKLNELFENKGLVILGGDLNRRLGTSEITEFSKVWELALSNEFDHIAFTPKGSWSVSNKKIITSPVISDHSPIMLTLTYNK